MKILAVITSLLAIICAWENNWELSDDNFDAIDLSLISKYDLIGKYGPNNMGQFGVYAYIYLEVGGDEIEDGQVVSTWATVMDYNISTNGQFETAECRVIYRQNRTYAAYEDIDVRTYKGRTEGFITSWTGEANVWDKSVTFLESRYQQDYYEDDGDNISRVGCYMQRLADDWISDFDIKNGIDYRVVVGYNIYSGSYDINSDILLDTSWDA